MLMSASLRIARNTVLMAANCSKGCHDASYYIRLCITTVVFIYIKRRSSLVDPRFLRAFFPFFLDVKPAGQEWTNTYQYWACFYKPGLSNQLISAISLWYKPYRTVFRTFHQSKSCSPAFIYVGTFRRGPNRGPKMACMGKFLFTLMVLTKFVQHQFVVYTCNIYIGCIVHITRLYPCPNICGNCWSGT